MYIVCTQPSYIYRESIERAKERDRERERDGIEHAKIEKERETNGQTDSTLVVTLNYILKVSKILLYSVLNSVSNLST